VGSAQQQVARLGEPERVTTVRSLDQTLADELLERSDLLADRRLRKAEPGRRAVERSLFGDRPKRDQVPELDPEPSRIKVQRVLLSRRRRARALVRSCDRSRCSPPSCSTTDSFLCENARAPGDLRHRLSAPVVGRRLDGNVGLMDLQVEFAPGVPLRRQLERQLRDAIRSGRLGAGSVLPPSRVLAEELGVSRGVVVDCYSQLTTEGYLMARTGSGTRVAYAPVPPRESAPERPAAGAATKIRFDLRPGQADFHAFPRRQWQAAMIRTLRELADRRLTYAEPSGIPELRHTIAEYLRRARAVVADSDDVVVFCGLSHGLTALWHALREHGARRVAIEDPGWRWQTRTVEHAGLEAVPVRVDDDGLVVSELAGARVDAVVLTPAHQYPTGVVLAPERRTELIEWARRHNALIVEDDYDAEYRYDRKPVAALQGLAPDVVVFASTTSKTLAPALRIGWMVLPSRLVGSVTNVQTVTAAQPSVIDQAAFATFIADASLDRHLRLMRRRYRAKRDLLLDVLEKQLPDVRVSGAAGGLHLLATLPDGADEAATAEAVRRRGVALHELHRHCTVHASAPAGLLLGYALPTASELQGGVKLIAQELR
jgi:GntR family transcriptional regulator/MocR family aminotransferase